MPMVEGTVSIDPVTAVATGAGLAKDVYDYLDGQQTYPASITPAAKAAARTQLAVLAKAIAKVIPHITANATVTVASGIAVSTTGTAAAQTGATTAPGTGTVA